jgi:hypothetical protein
MDKKRGPNVENDREDRQRVTVPCRPPRGRGLEPKVTQPAERREIAHCSSCGEAELAGLLDFEGRCRACREPSPGAAQPGWRLDEGSLDGSETWMYSDGDGRLLGTVARRADGWTAHVAPDGALAARKFPTRAAAKGGVR